MVESFLFGIKVLGTYVLIHILVCQILRGKFFLKLSLVLWLVTIVTGVAFFAPQLTWLGRVVGLTFFSLLWVIYVIILICSQNSMTLRMLDEIAQGPGQSLTIDRLFTAYTENESLEARLKMLQKNGLIVSDHIRQYSLTQKGKCLGKCSLYVRGLFSIS